MNEIHAWSMVDTVPRTGSTVKCESLQCSLAPTKMLLATGSRKEYLFLKVYLLATSKMDQFSRFCVHCYAISMTYSDLFRNKGEM